MNNIVSMPAARKAPSKARKSAKKVSRRAAGHVKPSRVYGGAVLGVGTVLLALSLTHLAQGIAMITGDSIAAFGPWSMAIGIDASFVCLELSMLLSSEILKARIAGIALPATWLTLAGSAVLNAMAFADHAPDGIYKVAAIGLGASIPALVYALARVGAILFTGKK